MPITISTTPAPKLAGDGVPGTSRVRHLPGLGHGVGQTPFVASLARAGRVVGLARRRERAPSAMGRSLALRLRLRHRGRAVSLRRLPFRFPHRRITALPAVATRRFGRPRVEEQLRRRKPRRRLAEVPGVYSAVPGQRRPAANEPVSRLDGEALARSRLVPRGHASRSRLPPR